MPLPSTSTHMVVMSCCYYFSRVYDVWDRNTDYDWGWCTGVHSVGDQVGLKHGEHVVSNKSRCDRYDEDTGDARFLILDPHYTGVDNVKSIQSKASKVCFLYFSGGDLITQSCIDIGVSDQWYSRSVVATCESFPCRSVQFFAHNVW